MAIDLFSIGRFTVHGYGLMIGLGFAAAVFMGCYLARKVGLSENDFTNIAIWVLVIGFMGGKLLYIIVEFKSFLTDPMRVLSSEGFVVYGGIITGVLSIIVYCRIKKQKSLQYLDLLGAVVPLNQSLGRIGCFLAGCCYGRRTDSWLGVEFPEGCIAPAHVKLLPTQLFMAAGDFVIFIVLVMYFLKVYKKGVQQVSANVKAQDVSPDLNGAHDFKKEPDKPEGSVAALYLVLYSIGRFIIEFFRNDVRGNVGALSTSQFIAIFTFLGGAALYIMLMKKVQTACKDRA